MDLIAFVSAISAVASILSIIFHIPDKIPIPLKKFILLLSAISWLIITVALHFSNVIPENNKNEPTIDVTPEATIFDPPAATIFDNSTSTPEQVQSNMLLIYPITDYSYKVMPIQAVAHEISPINIIKITGTISENGQYHDYEFAPENSGVHRFEFSDVPDGTDFRLELYNSGWERISSSSNMDNGDGLTVELAAGNTYHIRVQYYNNTGSYTLNIGLKKQIADITHFTTVSDSIQYNDQENDYAFCASRTGTYRFEFSNVPYGTDFRMEIYNSGWERIKSGYDMDAGDGLTIELTAGDTYYIRVQQYRSIGAYTLNIGYKKEIVTISDYTQVYDSIQYTDQENDYSFHANISGTYRIEFSGVPDGTDFRLELYNSGWERIRSDYDMDNGDGLTVELTADENYYFRVKHYRGTGIYALNIGLKKSIMDLTDYESVSDYIQYTDQENDYLFHVKDNGTYRFEFSDVPDGTDLRLEIYNSGWERITYNYDLDNGDGLTVSLSSEKTYYIRVSYYRGFGSYVLNVKQTSN